MLEISNLTKTFGVLCVSDDISFSLEKGERRVILGPNGAGKTTLFNLLTGVLQPDAGEIKIGGEEISSLSIDARARIGLARSYQKNNLFEDLTIGENLSLAVASAMKLSSPLLRDTYSDPALVESVRDIANKVALDDLLDMAVQNASYGNRRQLEVGLALASNPKVLLLDEPTSGVGPGMAQAFHDLLHGLSKDLTILIIEHDMDLAFDIADRITVLNYGKVVFEGTPDETRESSLVKEIYLGEWENHA